MGFIGQLRVADATGPVKEKHVRLSEEKEN
jgi:hypothetical protein